MSIFMIRKTIHFCSPKADCLHIHVAPKTVGDILYIYGFKETFKSCLV